MTRLHLLILLVCSSCAGSHATKLRSQKSMKKTSLEVSEPTLESLLDESDTSILLPTNHSETSGNGPNTPAVPVTGHAVHSLAGSGKLELLRDLLDVEPFWVMARDANGWTPLHEASRGAHVQIVDFLLERGAELNARAYNGGTPLYAAEKYNGRDSTIARYLTSLGAIRIDSKARLRGRVQDIDQDPRLPQRLAGEGRLEELVELVRKNGSTVLEMRDDNGWTPLHEAVRYGQLPIVRYLVESGVDINVRCNDGQTPLYFADAFLGDHAEVSQFLREEGGVAE